MESWGISSDSPFQPPVLHKKVLCVDQWYFWSSVVADIESILPTIGREI